MVVKDGQGEHNPKSTRSMKKMTTFVQLIKIQNVQLDSEVTRRYQSDIRTPPVEVYAKNNMINGCPPTQQSTSLATISISTPSKGLERTFEGEHHDDSPAKQNKVCLQLVNEASQNSNKFITMSLDTTKKIITQVGEERKLYHKC